MPFGQNIIIGRITLIHPKNLAMVTTKNYRGGKAVSGSQLVLFHWAFQTKIFGGVQVCVIRWR